MRTPQLDASPFVQPPHAVTEPTMGHMPTNPSNLSPHGRRRRCGDVAPSAVIVALLAMALMPALPALAGQTGELGGVVVDESAEPMPGVTVTLTSAQLIGGPRTDTTDVAGNFRFPNLDPGRYTIKLTSPGTVPFEETKITVGIDQRVDREYLLERAAAGADPQKVITVTATRPMVDVTAVSQGTRITPELTDRTATGRTYQDVALLAAGTVDGSVAPGNPSIHGGTPVSNVYLLDGLNITDPVTQTFSTNFNFDAIGELQILTGGLDAEYGNTTGGVLNIVTKSGGDEFSIDGSVYWAPTELQLLDAGDLDADGRPQLSNNSLNANISVGGPIIRRKLWFFLSGQYVDNTSTQGVSGSPFGDDFKLDPRRFNAFYGLGKLKWQLTPWQKFSLIIQGDPTWITNERQDPTVHPDAERQRFQGGVKIVTSSETTLSENLFWKSQVGYGADQLLIFPMSCDGDFDICARDAIPGHTNQATGTSTVNDTLLTDDRRFRLTAGSSLSYFLAGFLGDHEFKAGIEGAVTWNTVDNFVPGGQTFNDNGVDGANSSLTGAGDPFQVTVYDEPLNKLVSSNLFSLYVQDTWRPFKSLTIRPGIRFDSSRAYNDPEDGGLEVFNLNSVSPRIGAAWDPFGDAKTVVRGGYYLYNETGLLTVPSFVGRSLSSETREFNPATGEYDILVRREGGDDAVIFKPDMQAPNMHEFIFGVQRELFANAALAVDFTYRRRQNMFEDDEVNVIWNQRGDDAVGFHNNDPRFIFSVGTPDNAMGEYIGVDVVFEKRLSDNWQALATYTLSTLNGTAEDYITYTFDNSTQREFEYGALADDVRHKLRTTLSYDLPYGFQIGGTASYQSGRPLTKTFLNNFYGDFLDKRAPSGFDPKDVDNPDDDVEFRTPDTVFVDARVAWRLKELTTQDIWLMVDIFNLFNARPPTAFETRNLANFGQPLGRGAPLNAQVALRYAF